MIAVYVLFCLLLVFSSGYVLGHIDKGSSEKSKWTEFLWSLRDELVMRLGPVSDEEYQEAVTIVGQMVASGSVMSMNYILDAMAANVIDGRRIERREWFAGKPGSGQADSDCNAEAEAWVKEMPGARRSNRNIQAGYVPCNDGGEQEHAKKHKSYLA